MKIKQKFLKLKQKKGWIVKMTGWLIYTKEDAAYNQQYIKMHFEEAEKKNITLYFFYFEDFIYGIKNNEFFINHMADNIHITEKDRTNIPNFVLCRARVPMFSRQLEYLKIPVFNNAFVSEICNNKAKTYQYLAQFHIPMIDTAIYDSNALNSVLKEKNSNYEVIKSVDGHGGSQVFLTSQQSAKSLAHSDFVIQPLTGKKHQDVRVYVIGKKIVSAICRTAHSGFKSNFSLGGKVEVYPLSQSQKNTVRKIIDVFEFGLVGIDFLIGDNGEFIFNEIEDVVGARMLYQCTEINLLELYFEHIITVIGSRM